MATSMENTEKEMQIKHETLSQELQGRRNNSPDIGTCIFGAVFGMVVGYMASYIFQNDLIKEKLGGFGGYIVHFLDILTGEAGGSAAGKAWILIVVGAFFGVICGFSNNELESGEGESDEGA